MPKIKLPALGDADGLESGSVFVRELLPGNVIGMMLKLCGYDDVPFPDMLAKAACHGAESFRRSASEHDAVLAWRVDKGGDASTRCFELLGGGVGKVVGSSVHIAVPAVIMLDDAVEHAIGDLGRSCVVEVDQRMAVYLCLKDGEILANGLHVKHQRPLFAETATASGLSDSFSASPAFRRCCWRRA